MDENDATFESDSDSNVKVKGDVYMEGEKPYVEETPYGFSMDFDPGSGKGEARSGRGLGNVEVDLPDPPSGGKSPIQDGETLTGEAGDALDSAGGTGGNSSSRDRPRVDKDRADRNSGNPSRRFYNNINELEREVEKEQKNIKEIVDNLANKCKEQQDILQGKINQAGSNYNGLATGVFGKLPPIPSLPTAPPPRPLPPRLGSQPSTPSNAPLGQKVRRTFFHLEFAKTNVPPNSQLLIDIAQETFNKADQLCAIGDLENGNQALESADTLAQSALSPNLHPSPPGSPAPPGSASEVEQRANAQNTGLDLYRAANSLNNAGFPGLASSLRITAGDIFNFALGLARSSKLLDLPLNIMEGFAGKTIEFNDAGNIVIKDAETVDRIFALVDVALTVGAVASGGLSALIGASVISNLDKKTTERLTNIAIQIKDKIRRGESFDIPEFPEFPAGAAIPSGPFKFLTELEVKVAQPSAKRGRRKIRTDNPSIYTSKEIHAHHKQPVKWGGSLEDADNFEPLDSVTHGKVSSWWYSFQTIVTKELK
jgi:hypothetical protein